MGYYKIAGAVTLATFAATPALAQDTAQDTGMYFQLNAGIAKVEEAEVTFFDGGDTYETSADFDNAFAFGGALGYDFGTVRAELQVDYNRNDIDGLTLERFNGAAVTLTPADIADICDYLEADNCSGSGNTIRVEGSRARQLSALANVWFDIPVGDSVVPYIGGGAGIGGFEVDGEGKAGFAWQLGAGVGFDLSESIVVSLDYRRRQVKGGDTDDGFSRVGNIKTNFVSAGLRFRF